jgi:hypothetical protein
MRIAHRARLIAGKQQRRKTMSKKATRPRTTEQVLKDQAEQAEHRRGNTAMVKAAANALAADNDNPWLEVSAELDRFLGAPFVKFSKTGGYPISDTENLPDGVRCIAHTDETEFGWTRWQDGKPAEKRMGRVADRFVPAQRSDLGDTDERQWEIQTDGTRRDPWQFGATMPITRLDSRETYQFTTGSKGGLRCVNGLSRVYGRRVQTEKVPGLPVIQLKSDRYKHHEYGWIYYPVMPVVGWTGADGKPLSLAEELNDEVGI